MIAKHLPLLLAAVGAGVSAQVLARFVPQVFDERSIRPSGGWALRPEKECPNDLDICFGGTCCPTSLTCVESGGADSLCCPGTTSCQTAYEAAPFCADDSWSLWDESQGGINNKGYFCCAPGDVGLLDGSCVANATIFSPTQMALQLQPGGHPVSTSTVVASTSVSTSVHVTTAKTTTVVSTSTSDSTSTTSDLATSSVKGLGSSTATHASTATSAPVSTHATGSPSPSATASSDGNTYKGFRSLWLVQTAFALLVGAAL